MCCSRSCRASRGDSSNNPLNNLDPRVLCDTSALKGALGSHFSGATSGPGLDCMNYPDQYVQCMMQDADNQVREGMRQVEHGVRDFAASPGMQGTANWFAGTANVFGLIGFALDATGIGLPEGISLDAISLGLNFVAPTIYCTADPSSSNCLFGMDSSGPHVTKTKGRHAA
jgi:hypothetical protein